MSTALEEHGRFGLAPESASAKPHSPVRVPFTVLDEAVHLLDTPSEPWSIELELQVPGRIDEDRLRAAVNEAMARHPMTRVRLLPARHTDRHWVWEVSPQPQLDPLTVVQADTDDEVSAVRAELQSISVPLVESPPFRLRLVHAPGGDSVMLNANHTAFDGFGCVRFLQSVARAYTEAPDPPAPVSLSQARNMPALLSADDPSARKRRFQALIGQGRNIVRTPARIVPKQGIDEPGYGIVHRALTVNETKALDEADVPGTVNDLLLAALHLSIEQWNTELGSRPGRITAFMPVNLRPKEWKHDVVTNVVLLSSVSTAASDRRNRRSAVDAIAQQTQRVKEWGTGAALFEILQRTARMPLGIKQALSPFLWLTGNRLVDSALLTNLARISEPPWFGREAGETKSMWFSAPARMPCGLSLGALTVDGRLHLSFRYRSPLLGRRAADEFAERYVKELLSLPS